MKKFLSIFLMIFGFAIGLDAMNVDTNAGKVDATKAGKRVSFLIGDKTTRPGEEVEHEAEKPKKKLDGEKLDGEKKKPVQAVQKETPVNIEDIFKKIKAGQISADAVFGDKKEGILHLAVRTNQPEIIRELIELKIPKLNLNQKADKDRTALYLAAIHDHVTVVKILLAAGADATIADYKGNLPLHLAAHNGCHNVIQVLLNAKKISNIDVVNHDRYTALHQAALQGRYKTVVLLCKAKANILAVTKGGMTPLALARQGRKGAKQEKIECFDLTIKILEQLEAGKSVDQIDLLDKAQAQAQDDSLYDS